MSLNDQRNHLPEDVLDTLWPEDQDFTMEDWRDEVRSRDTRLGYEDWVIHQQESARFEQEDIS